MGMNLITLEGIWLPAANPTIVNYNASAVKSYKATSDFKKYFLLLWKTFYPTLYYNAGVVVVNTEVVGLSPG
jgi:hypothetical protein